MSAEPELMYCEQVDGNFCHETAADCVSCTDLNPGDTIYVGEVERITVAQIFDARIMIDHAGDLAHDLGGEHAEDYPPEIDDEAIDELQKLVNTWAAKHKLEPSFYQIKNVKPYVITVEDCA